MRNLDIKNVKVFKNTEELKLSNAYKLEVVNKAIEVVTEVINQMPEEDIN